RRSSNTMAQIFGPGGSREPGDPLDSILKFATGERRPRVPWVWIVVGLVALTIIVVLGVVPGIYTDLLWFRSLELESVFIISLRARAGLFAMGTLVAFLFVFGNVLLARYLAGRQELAHIPRQERLGPGRLVMVAMIAGA